MLSELPDHPFNVPLEAALYYSRLGYRCVPVLPGSKQSAIKWKDYQTQTPTEEDYQRWFNDAKMNLALLAGDVIFVDVDAANELDFVLEKVGKTPSISQTPRGGFHLPYRARKGVDVPNQVQVKGRDIDIRPSGTYVLEAPSRNADGVPYRWLSPLVEPAALPVFRVSWMRNRTKRKLQALQVDDDVDQRERRALAYLAHVEGAIAGQRGHDRTMRVAGVLVQKFRLELESALRIMKVWNETCEPPWSEKELRHKLESALWRRQ